MKSAGIWLWHNLAADWHRGCAFSALHRHDHALAEHHFARQARHLKAAA